jgi:hypothetical protein
MSGVDPFHAERGTDADVARVLAETSPGGTAAMAAAATLEEQYQIAFADNDRILLERQEEEEVSHHSWAGGRERAPF